MSVRPTSIDGVIQTANLVSSTLLSADESQFDELNRSFLSEEVLFINTIPTQRSPTYAAWRGLRCWRRQPYAINSTTFKVVGFVEWESFYGKLTDEGKKQIKDAKFNEQLKVDVLDKGPKKPAGEAGKVFDTINEQLLKYYPDYGAKKGMIFE